MVHRVDLSDNRRTAESVLGIEADEIPDLIVELAKSKRLSVVIGNLNRLMLTMSLVGALCVILALSPTEPVLNRGRLFGSEEEEEHEMQSG